MARKKIDLLEEKRKELNAYVDMSGTAVSLVSSTVNNLKEINSLIDGKIKEIEDYQASLVETRAGLGDTKRKNEKIIKNFSALLEAE